MKSSPFVARALLTALALPLLAAVGAAQDVPDAQDTKDAQDTERAKRQRLKDNAADFWIYDDLRQGYAQAKAKGKPLLVSFRCVP